MNGRRTAILASVALPPLLLTALYLPSLDFEFVWTDQGEIEHGILIQPHGRLLEAFVQPMHPDLDSLAPAAAQPYYRPLQVVVATVIDDEFGRRPRAFRSATIALGALGIALFAAICWWLFRDPLQTALAASIAAAHPVGVEMHVWVAGLSGSLAHVFVLASLGAAVGVGEARSQAARAAWALASIVAFVLGLLSKESAIVAPALLFALLLSRWRGAGSPVASRAVLGLVAAQGLVAALFALWWRPRILAETFAGSSPIGGDLATHLATAVASWPARIGWLFAPTDSTTSDVVRIAPSFLDPAALMGVALALLSIFVWWRLLTRGREIAALGLAWVWIAFLPTSGLVPLTHMKAERYVALSLFGAALMAADLLPQIARVLAPKAPRIVTALLGVVIVAGLAERTAARVPQWRSNLELFGADTSSDPLFREGYYILASTHADAGRFEEAYVQLERLRATGEHFAGLSSYLRADDAFLLQCRVNRMLGRSSETLPLFADQLDAENHQLPLAPALFLCGARSLVDAGRASEGLAIATRVRDLDPARPDPLAALVVARALIELGRFDEAKSALAAIAPVSLATSTLDAEARNVRALLRARRRNADPDPASQ